MAAFVGVTWHGSGQSAKLRAREVVFSREEHTYLLYSANQLALKMYIGSIKWMEQVLFRNIYDTSMYTITICPKRGHKFEEEVQYS